MTAVDRLVEEMVTKYLPARPKKTAIEMLRVVLSAIESGEVVEIGEEYINNEKLDRMEWFYKIKLNPDFKAWLNGEGKK